MDKLTQVMIAGFSLAISICLIVFPNKIINFLGLISLILTFIFASLELEEENINNPSQRKKDENLMGKSSRDTKDEGGSKEPSKRLESGNHADIFIKQEAKE